MSENIRNNPPGKGKNRDDKNHPGQAGGDRIPEKNIHSQHSPEINRNNRDQDKTFNR